MFSAASILPVYKFIFYYDSETIQNPFSYIIEMINTIIVKNVVEKKLRTFLNCLFYFLFSIVILCFIKENYDNLPK